MITAMPLTPSRIDKMDFNHFSKNSLSVFKNPPKKVFISDIIEIYWLLTSTEKFFFKFKLESSICLNYTLYKIHTLCKHLLSLAIFFRKEIELGNLDKDFSKFKGKIWRGDISHAKGSSYNNIDMCGIFHKIIHADNIKAICIIFCSMLD